MSLELQHWGPSLQAFSKWLAAESTATVKQWSKRLQSDDFAKAKAAVAEAVVWDFLACRTESVRLAEVPGTGGLDFQFAVGAKSFLVEVTNISKDTAARSSAMSDEGPHSGFYGLLTDHIRQKVRKKFAQAHQQAVEPFLIAVTTLHWNASRTCVNSHAVEFAMGSPPCITWDIDADSAMADGKIYQSTDLKRSVFLAPSLVLGSDGQPVAQAKFEPIAGFLLGGFGLQPRDVRVYGGLNPVVVFPFEPGLLPDIPFCSFRQWPASGTLEFLWTISDEDERTRSLQAATKRLHAAGLGKLVEGIRREQTMRMERLP